MRLSPEEIESYLNSVLPDAKSIADCPVNRVDPTPYKACNSSGEVFLCQNPYARSVEVLYKNGTKQTFNYDTAPNFDSSVMVSQTMIHLQPQKVYVEARQEKRSRRKEEITF